MALKEKIKVKDKYSKEFLTDIMLKDFLGKLSKFEIEIAKENGLLVWDLLIKSQKLRLQYQHSESLRLAPVLNRNGEIDKQRYPENVKFLIKDYADLEAKTANK